MKTQAFAAKAAVCLLLCAALAGCGAEAEDYGSLAAEFEAAGGVITSAERETPAIISEVGSLSDHEAVWEDETYALYCTFDDPEAAAAAVAEECGGVLELLQSEYSLDELSAENWREYYSVMYAVMDKDSCPNWYNESDEGFRKLRAFCDIMDGGEQNCEILRRLQTGESVSGLLPDT
ncbi:MAG: hypothetical protein LUE15_05020 [Oscillospiraceae bacterium]|nr:hypothetical protein [Oscillospiraceae bacterium]